MTQGKNIAANDIPISAKISMGTFWDTRLSGNKKR